jgi:cytochrome c-type biogenesis protein CcmE
MNDEAMVPVETLSPRKTRMFLLGALAVAGLAFLFITVGGIGDNLVYYWGPTDIQQAGDKAVGATIRLGGMVQAGSIKGGTQGSQLEFAVSDGKNVVQVKSKGVPPQMFRERIGVVVEGTMTKDGYFACNRLMVSHSNEYKAPHDTDKVDVKKLIQDAEKQAAEGSRQ